MDAGSLPAIPGMSPNGFELTGAGLRPRRTDDNENAGVRCSEVLDDGGYRPGTWLTE